MSVGASGPEDNKVVPIVWQGIEEAPLVFSNAIIVQHTPHEFVLTFGFVQPPIVTGSDDMERVEQVTAKASVRVALPPTRTKQFLEVLSNNFKVYVEALHSRAEQTAVEPKAPQSAR